MVPLSLQINGPRARLTLWMLMGAVFCVLLIAATNAASLSLARSAGRKKEIAIRAELGASPGRIVRQLLAESLTLAVASGLLGLLIAVSGIRLILALKPVGLARLSEIDLDPRVLGCSLALCLLTGILIGLAPALAAVRCNLRSSGQRGLRGVLVVTEFALAALLMAAIGIYGLVQYSVATRTREIGIRMAVGARTGEIFRIVIREGLRLSLTGLALGLVGSLFVGRAGSSLLFGVTGTDPSTFIGVSLLLVAVALVACYFPARRAMKIEPTVALRQE